MLHRVKNYIIQQEMLQPGDFVLLAVSGGPDSMALLHIMKELRGELDFSIAAAHLNHGLRNEAADEEELVRRYCSEWEVPFYSRTIDVKTAAREEKKTLEEAGRDCRYRYFAELLVDLGAGRIATAHHQDDSAETVLLHLLRGSGIKGLRGIMPVKGNLIRPLLGVSKKQIIDYLDENAIAYCIDQSNFDSVYLRNRIRNSLIPHLQENYNPRIVEGLNNLAEIAREENDALEKQSCLYWDKLITDTRPYGLVMNKSILQELHPAFQRRLILKALTCLKGESGWDMSDVQKVRELAGKTGSAKYIVLKHGMKVKTVYDELHFMPQILPAVSYQYEIKVPCNIKIASTGEIFSFAIGDAADLAQEELKKCLDFDRLEQPLYLRSRLEGDFFYPQGMKGRKKVKDYFIDKKLPLTQRNRVPLLASADTVYAVVGFRISRLGAAGPDSKRVLIIRKVRHEE